VLRVLVKELGIQLVAAAARVLLLLLLLLGGRALLLRAPRRLLLLVRAHQPRVVQGRLGRGQQGGDLLCRVGGGPARRAPGRQHQGAGCRRGLCSGTVVRKVCYGDVDPDVDAGHLQRPLCGAG
jgi:hypothetical protein